MITCITNRGHLIVALLGRFYQTQSGAQSTAGVATPQPFSTRVIKTLQKRKTTFDGALRRETSSPHRGKRPLLSVEVPSRRGVDQSRGIDEDHVGAEAVFHADVDLSGVERSHGVPLETAILGLDIRLPRWLWSARVGGDQGRFIYFFRQGRKVDQGHQQSESVVSWIYLDRGHY